MTTLDQSNKLATQPQNPFRWLSRWLAWLHEPNDTKSGIVENETERIIHLRSQQEIAHYMAERSTRCL